MPLSKEQKKILDNAWLGIQVKEQDLFNPLKSIIYDFEDEAHLALSYLMMQPEFFALFCQEIMNVQLLPTQMVLLKESWTRKFPMWIATRGFSKSFMEGVYCLLRAVLIPNRNIIICGSVFRQSKIVFEYIEKIYRNAPRLQEICDRGAEKVLAKDTDVWRMRIGNSNILAVPVGNTGEGVRGLRANDLLAEEFAAHNRDIFEVILSGFTAVSADPLEKIKKEAAAELASKLGWEIEEVTNPFIPTNQLLICGTAYYQFNHFYEYWRKWKAIIETGGDEEKIRTMFGDNSLTANLNPRDYIIFRIPVELVPKGFMDDSQIARSKASMHSGNFACEFGATFQNDSAGFFKRSLIESCVASDKNNLRNSRGPIIFHPTLRGSNNGRYVMAIDPASEHDNFAIVIIEIHPDHRRIVYCWTITRREQKERIKEGMINENDFYKYCTMKIRELMRYFNIERIAIDSQGGRPISEALSSNADIKLNEQPIYEIIDPSNYKDTDSMKGLHIIEMIHFADAKWVSDANHGMRKDFEDKMLLFPHFDPLSLGFASYVDEKSNKMFDTLEDCVTEIEELKDELSTIVMSTTGVSNRERWDTPDKIATTGKKSKMRKDRYSALLMANASSKKLTTVIEVYNQISIGGFTFEGVKGDLGGPSFLGPQDLVHELAKLYSSV